MRWQRVNTPKLARLFLLTVFFVLIATPLVLVAQESDEAQEWIPVGHYCDMGSGSHPPDRSNYESPQNDNNATFCSSSNRCEIERPFNNCEGLMNNRIQAQDARGNTREIAPFNPRDPSTFSFERFVILEIGTARGGFANFIDDLGNGNNIEDGRYRWCNGPFTNNDVAVSVRYQRCLPKCGKCEKLVQIPHNNRCNNRTGPWYKPNQVDEDDNAACNDNGNQSSTYFTYECQAIPSCIGEEPDEHIFATENGDLNVPLYREMLKEVPQECWDSAGGKPEWLDSSYDEMTQEDFVNSISYSYDGGTFVDNSINGAGPTAAYSGRFALNNTDKTYTYYAQQACGIDVVRPKDQCEAALGPCYERLESPENAVINGSDGVDGFVHVMDWLHNNPTQQFYMPDFVPYYNTSFYRGETTGRSTSPYNDGFRPEGTKLLENIQTHIYSKAGNEEDSDYRFAGGCVLKSYISECQVPEPEIDEEEPQGEPLPRGSDWRGDCGVGIWNIDKRDIFPSRTGCYNPEERFSHTAFTVAPSNASGVEEGSAFGYFESNGNSVSSMLAAGSAAAEESTALRIPEAPVPGMPRDDILNLHPLCVAKKYKQGGQILVAERDLMLGEIGSAITCMYDDFIDDFDDFCQYYLPELGNNTANSDRNMTIKWVWNSNTNCWEEQESPVTIQEFPGEHWMPLATRFRADLGAQSLSGEITGEPIIGTSHSKSHGDLGPYGFVYPAPVADEKQLELYEKPSALNPIYKGDTIKGCFFSEEDGGNGNRVDCKVGADGTTGAYTTEPWVWEDEEPQENWDNVYSIPDLTVGNSASAAAQLIFDRNNMGVRQKRMECLKIYVESYAHAADCGQVVLDGAPRNVDMGHCQWVARNRAHHGNNGSPRGMRSEAFDYESFHTASWIPNSPTTVSLSNGVGSSSSDICSRPILDGSGKDGFFSRGNALVMKPKSETINGVTIRYSVFEDNPDEATESKEGLDFRQRGCPQLDPMDRWPDVFSSTCNLSQGAVRLTQMLRADNLGNTIQELLEMAGADINSALGGMHWLTTDINDLRSIITIEMPTLPQLQLTFPPFPAPYGAGTPKLVRMPENFVTLPHDAWLTQMGGPPVYGMLRFDFNNLAPTPSTAPEDNGGNSLGVYLQTKTGFPVLYLKFYEQARGLWNSWVDNYKNNGDFDTINSETFGLSSIFNEAQDEDEGVEAYLEESDNGTGGNVVENTLKSLGQRDWVDPSWDARSCTHFFDDSLDSYRVAPDLNYEDLGDLASFFSTSSDRVGPEGDGTEVTSTNQCDSGPRQGEECASNSECATTEAPNAQCITTQSTVNKIPKMFGFQLVDENMQSYAGNKRVYQFLPNPWALKQYIAGSQYTPLWCDFQLPFDPYTSITSWMKLQNKGGVLKMPGYSAVHYNLTRRHPEYRMKLDHYEVERIRNACGPFNHRGSWSEDPNQHLVKFMMGKGGVSRCQNWKGVFGKKYENPKVTSWRLPRFDYEFLHAFIGCTGPVREPVPACDTSTMAYPNLVPDADFPGKAAALQAAQGFLDKCNSFPSNISINNLFNSSEGEAVPEELEDLDDETLDAISDAADAMEDATEDVAEEASELSEDVGEGLDEAATDTTETVSLAELYEKGFKCMCRMGNLKEVAVETFKAIRASVKIISLTANMASEAREGERPQFIADGAPLAMEGVNLGSSIVKIAKRLKLGDQCADLEPPNLENDLKAVNEACYISSLTTAFAHMGMAIQAAAVGNASSASNHMMKTLNAYAQGDNCTGPMHIDWERFNLPYDESNNVIGEADAVTGVAGLATESETVTDSKKYGFWCGCPEDNTRTTRCREDFCTCEQHVLVTGLNGIQGVLPGLKPTAICRDYGPFKRWLECYYQARARACPVLTRDISNGIPASGLLFGYPYNPKKQGDVEASW